MESAKKGILQSRLIRREDGVSLNEVLVSIALISIGILGSSLTTIKVIQGNYTSGNVTAATILAQDKMEELKGLVTLNNVDNCASPPDQDITVTGSAGGIYDRCWAIKGSALGAGLKEVTVTVRWTDYLSHEVILSTLVFTG